MLGTAIVGGLGAFLASLCLTPLIRWSARQFGYVAHPRQDRWHHKPTALFGGVAIFLAFFLPFVALHEFDKSILFILAGAAVVFGLGLADDLFSVPPYTKLVVQIAAASLVTFGSLNLPPQALSLVVIPLAIFWLVGLTNAFNLLDNMDGLSAGTACIASLFLFAISVTTGNVAVALCSAILFGATLGFLFYNFHPATIFMGDSGSMFLGFILAALAMHSWEQATNLALMMLTPVLVLAVPIFDTTFVTLVRWKNGRAISEGGRDHASHRLVAFGLPERKAVLLFYLISLTCGSIAFLGILYNALLLSLLGAVMVIVIVNFGMFLSGIVTYESENGVRKQAAPDRGVVLDIFLMDKRRILEVLGDAVFIILAYASSFAIRFDGNIPPEHFRVLAQSLPVVLLLKLLIFSSFGLYRGVWRYAGMQDLIAIVKAISLSSIVGITAMTMLFRFELFPRSVFIIDWMALLLLVAGGRILIRIIREYLFSLSDVTAKKRIGIVGGGDAGELALRELRNNVGLGWIPVGVFDDDPGKQGRRIHGVPVVGGTDNLVESVARLKIEQIVVAIPSAAPETLDRIIEKCRMTGLPVTVMPSLGDLFQKTSWAGVLAGEALIPQPGVTGITKRQTLQ
ncbi:MAG: hypothetical protein VST66_09335 [Nitrospirota bacterium]|nr:hypothetical protein [Nitrospirota bacterium]